MEASTTKRTKDKPFSSRYDVRLKTKSRAKEWNISQKEANNQTKHLNTNIGLMKNNITLFLHTPMFALRCFCVLQMVVFI